MSCYVSYTVIPPYSHTVGTLVIFEMKRAYKNGGYVEVEGMTDNKEPRCNFYKRQRLIIRRFPTQDDVGTSERDENDEKLDVQSEEKWKEDIYQSYYENYEDADLNEVIDNHDAAVSTNTSPAAEEPKFIHDQEISSIFQLFLKQTVSQRQSAFEESQKLKQECADVQQQLKLLHKCCDVAHEKINVLENENGVLKEVNAYLKKLLADRK
ncbi:6681_t:CDS:2 [Ambispora gerdemannii]|uniref:6681_t:CDS:1 n=1 Tax=Ambispora gerdemannii TaxID=144530 RepID=A0A9N9AEI4_9GLOM|nr:6681_t:CDS:2 [Ambispora gerdemannii]